MCLFGCLVGVVTNSKKADNNSISDDNKKRRPGTGRTSMMTMIMIMEMMTVTIDDHEDHTKK